MKQANRHTFLAKSGEYGDDAMGRNTAKKRKMRQTNTKASLKNELGGD